MRRARAFAALIGAIGILAVAPGAAQATHFDVWYCGTVKGSGHWCGQPPYTGGHSWDANNAIYPGAQSIWVCQRVWYPAGGYALPGASCEPDSGVGHYYGDIQCPCYEAHAAQVSGFNHTIWGFAEA